MKRLIVFILLCLLLCGLNLSSISNFDLQSLFYGSELEIYLSERENIANLNYVQNGEGAIVYGRIDHLKDLLKLHNIIGFTIKIKNCNYVDVINKLSPSFVYDCGEYVYGNASTINFGFGHINGNNFQLAYSGDRVLLGIPILLGSY